MGHYSNECKEELSKTPEGKKDTSLLINKEDSSDKESVQEDQYNLDGGSKEESVHGDW